MPLAVLVADPLVVGHRIVGQMGQVVLRRADILLDLADLVVGLLGIVARNADKLQLGELLHILKRYFTPQLFLEGFQPFIDSRIGLLTGLATLDQLVELVLDEDAFERGGMPCLLQLPEADLQLAAQQVFRMFGRAAEDLLHAEEVRLVLPDDACVRRDRHLAVREGIERIDGLVRRFVGGHLDHDLHLVGRIVVHLADLDLSLVVGLDDRLLDRLGGRRIGDLRDGEGPLVDLRDLRTHLDRTAPQTVVVAAYVGHAARREVGVKLEITSLEVRDGRVDQLVEVVRQDLRCEAHGNTVRALRQQQRELDRQRNGFFIAAVVGAHPLGGLAVENHLKGEFRETRLDITTRGGIVAREDIAPVALAVDQQVLLTQLHESVLDRRIAVRVVLHRLADDTRHLVVAAVVHTPHGVQNTPLHGFQTILHVRNGPFQNNVRGVIQEPVAVHARKLADPFVLRDPVVLARPGRRDGCRRSGIAPGSGLRGGRIGRSGGIPGRQVLRIFILVCHSQLIFKSCSTRSSSMRRLSMMKPWRSKVFLPM